MAGLSRLLTRSPKGAADRPGAMAAVPNAVLAAGFLALTVTVFLGMSPVVPCEGLLVIWCVFELAALWFLPVVQLVFRLAGDRGVAVLVKSVLPVAGVLTLVPGIVLESPLFLAAGVFVVLAQNKTISYWASSLGQEGGERLLARVLICGFTWTISVLAAALSVFVLRFAFSPADLSSGELLAATLFLSGFAYFSALAAIELSMPRYPVVEPSGDEELPRSRDREVAEVHAE